MCVCVDSGGCSTLACIFELATTIEIMLALLLPDLPTQVDVRKLMQAGYPTVKSISQAFKKFMTNLLGKARGYFGVFQDRFELFLTVIIVSSLNR